MVFLIETGKNKTMRNENMATKTVEELLDVANGKTDKTLRNTNLLIEKENFIYYSFISDFVGPHI